MQEIAVLKRVLYEGRFKGNVINLRKTRCENVVFFMLKKPEIEIKKIYNHLNTFVFLKICFIAYKKIPRKIL